MYDIFADFKIATGNQALEKEKTTGEGGGGGGECISQRCCRSGKDVAHDTVA